MVKAGARLDVKSKKSIPLFNIAYKSRNSDMLALVMKYLSDTKEKERRYTIYDAILKDEVIYNEAVNA
jgi:hypothetical protein